MKMISKIALASVLAAGLSTPAFAQDMGGYGDIGVGVVDVDGFGEFTTVTGHLGYDFNDYFAVEGQLGFGVDGPSVSGVDVDLDYLAGAYLVVSTPMNNGFEIFGRLGYATAEVSANGFSASGDGVDYGAGFKYYFDGVNGIRGDISFQEDANFYGLAYTRKF